MGFGEPPPPPPVVVGDPGVPDVEDPGPDGGAAIAVAHLVMYWTVTPAPLALVPVVSFPFPNPLQCAPDC